MVKNNYRRNKWFWGLLLTIILVLSLFYIYLSPSAFYARKHVERSKNVKIGMTKQEVIAIIGVPDSKILSFENSKDSMYYYVPPFGASEGIYIQFDSLNYVNKIFPYE